MATRTAMRLGPVCPACDTRQPPSVVVPRPVAYVCVHCGLGIPRGAEAISTIRLGDWIDTHRADYEYLNRRLFPNVEERLRPARGHPTSRSTRYLALSCFQRSATIIDPSPPLPLPEERDS